MAIHPTAVVSPDAEIGNNVEIGPYAIIESDVKIGDDCFIDAHVKIGQYTTIGPRCRIYLGAFVGAEPQDHRFYKGIESYTEVGSDTVLREYVTIHRPPFEFQKTVIGNHVLLMSFVHVGHDTVIADQVTIANNTVLAGHVQIARGAVLSADIRVHQFCRIGALAMIGAAGTILQDVPPFCLTDHEGRLAGVNTIGLRRAGMASGPRLALRNAVRTYFFKGLNGKNALEEIQSGEMPGEVQHFVNFIKESSRGIVSPVSRTAGGEDAAE